MTIGNLHSLIRLSVVLSKVHNSITVYMSIISSKRQYFKCNNSINAKCMTSLLQLLLMDRDQSITVSPPIATMASPCWMACHFLYVLYTQVHLSPWYTILDLINDISNGPTLLSPTSWATVQTIAKLHTSRQCF